MPIHSSIKEALGYPKDEPDKSVLRDWKGRLRRVCKPCWELKYCPYGPLVEQSPMLPAERAGMIEHNEYFKKISRTGQTGDIETLSEERRKDYAAWLRDDDLLAWQAYNELRNEASYSRIAASKNPLEEFERLFHGELPPIHLYRVQYEVDNAFDFDSLTAAQKKQLRKKITERKKTLRAALKTGVEDTRKPLDPGRRAYFAKEVREFDAENYPESVPDIFTDGECNVFGHICPVFFTAEAFTETSTERRRGRYIPFTVKMRVVRRDNHTCQHCGKHLADTEVEFDHKIPISKGGSSEEHNIRLTCFGCNRDKKDQVEI